MTNITNLVITMVAELKKEFKAVELVDIDTAKNIITFEVEGVTVTTLATINMKAFMANMVTRVLDATLVGDNRQSKYKQELFFKALEAGLVPAKVSAYKATTAAKLEKVLGY